jgi:hypothetical protein
VLFLLDRRGAVGDRLDGSRGAVHERLADGRGVDDDRLGGVRGRGECAGGVACRAV